jgi:hypothetical protein
MMRNASKVVDRHLRCRPVSHARVGATMVEFAFVVPIFFILFFASIEFSRVAMIRHTVDNAVYEAARMAIIPGGTAGVAQTEARRLLAVIGVSRSSIEITPTSILRSTPSVTVRISVPIDANSYVPSQYFSGRSITRELTLRREGA